MKQYPKWIYSREGSKVIESGDEHPGEGWYDSPADIPDAKQDLAHVQQRPDPDTEPEEIAPSNQEADPEQSDGNGHTVESVREELDKRGIPYDRRFGVERLLSLIPPAEFADTQSDPQ